MKRYGKRGDEAGSWFGSNEMGESSSWLNLVSLQSDSYGNILEFGIV